MEYSEIFLEDHIPLKYVFGYLYEDREAGCLESNPESADANVTVVFVPQSIRSLDDVIEPSS